MAKLTQILAIEKNTKNRCETEFTKIFQEVQKADLANGFSKTYRPRDADGEMFPAEGKKVQVRAEERIKRLKSVLTELFDVTATKDATNCNAKADVVVDGVTILKQVPATHLLFIEKKLVDLLSFVKKLPALDQADEWHEDPALGLWATTPAESFKGKKVTTFDIVVPATKEHPAQVKEISKDIIIGTWTTTKFSGALDARRIEELTERVEKLQKAVKFAREEANTVQTTELKTGEAVLGYIFG